MNDPQANGSDSNDPATELDVLLSRAVAGDGAALAEVRARGAADPSVLDELTLWQADELRLARVARELQRTADSVDAPRSRSRMRERWAGAGWAVAAVLAIAWLMQLVSPRGTAREASVAGIAPAFQSSEEAFDAYVAKAREEGVLSGEVAPPTLLGSRELGDGRGFEVVIIRQVIERRVSPEIYRITPAGESGPRRTLIIRPRTDLVQ